MPTSANITTAGDIAFTLPVGAWGVRVINESDTLIRRLLGQPAATSGARLGLPLAAGAGETLVFKQPLKQAVAYCAIHGGSGNKTLTYEIITQPTQGGTGPSSSTGGGGASNALLLAGASASTLADLTAATAATGGLFYGTQSGADRKFTLSAVGAALIEAADAAAQRTALSAAGLGTNTFTGLQTITQATANAGILASTGYSLTGSNATSMVSLKGTWKTSGTPALLDYSLTDTASNASSLLMRFRAGTSGTDEAFSIRKDGAIRCGAGALPLILNGLYGTTTFTQFGDGGLQVNASFRTAQDLIVDGTGRKLFLNNATAYLSFNDDLILSRPAAATLQLGMDHATTPTAQRFKAHNVTTGTGADLELAGGTGSVANGTVKIVDGKLNVAGIPTSSAGLASGDVWSNSGVLTVV